MTTENKMHELPLPLLVLRLRAVVLALGESTSPPWWNTKFMNKTGLSFLERLYPRTALHAAIRAAGKAACDAHDRAAGRVGVYHLFRFPESLEMELNRMPPDRANEFFPTFRNAMGCPEVLMQLLASMCGGERADDASGARKIGTEKDILTPAGIMKAAAVYHTAFARNRPAFPYFTVESQGDSRWP